MVKKTTGSTRTITRVVRAARRGAPRAAGIMGKLRPVLDGAIGGYAARMGLSIHPYGAPIGLAGAGYFLNNPTLLTLAGMQVSAMLPTFGLGAGNTPRVTGGY